MPKQVQIRCAGTCGDITPHNMMGPNHVVHAILSLVTFGLWLIIWLLVAAAPGTIAACSRCGTQRDTKNAALTADDRNRHTHDINTAFSKIQGPMKSCRQRHSIEGPITFKLRYEANGTITHATIDSGPPNITPDFVQDSTTLLKGMLTLPAHPSAGVMDFNDAG